MASHSGKHCTCTTSNTVTQDKRTAGLSAADFENPAPIFRAVPAQKETTKEDSFNWQKSERDAYGQS